MTKKYLKLTEDQKKRGVIFSSVLVPGNTIHEVLATDTDKDIVMRRLLDDKFFNHCELFKYNLIRN